MVPAAPLAPRSGPRLSPGRLLTEAQHRPDALAPVPQPQGRQVPTDHLHLAVQLHLAVAPATSCHLSALKLPLSRRAAPRRAAAGVLEHAAVRGSACLLVVPTSPVSLYSGSTSPAGTDGVPSPLQGQVRTVAAARGGRTPTT